jgi:tetratricopeptide (TPR) repeat protein
LDAGEQIGTDGPVPALTADAYQVPVSYGSCAFRSTRIFRARAPWVWKYRVHETAVGCGRVDHLDCVEVFSDLGDQRAAKWERYARLSDLDLVDHPDDPRVVFYAAQNHYAAGNYARALNLYARRTALGGWSEEVWYATMREGMCLEQLGSFDHARLRYVEAFELNRGRAEPARHLARMLQSEAWAQVADEIPRPTSGLFVELDAYK